MKSRILFSFFFFFSLIKGISQNEQLYQIKIVTIDNKSVSISEYRAKKILIYVCDIAAPNLSELKDLDTLYQKNKTKLSVILVPVSDLSPSGQINRFKKMLDTLNLSYTIAQTAKGKKSDGATQNALLSYLTDKAQNKHFNVDITASGECFILSEKGKLYARLTKGIPINGNVMSKIINRNVTD